MDRAIIFDVDGTLSETEETHRRAFHAAFAAPAIPDVDLEEYIPAWHAQKTAAYTNMVSGGEIELRPGIRELIEEALAKAGPAGECLRRARL